MSEFMGKRVNMFLILMLILVLLGIGGISIYYQRTFKDVTSQYDSVSNTLASCQENLSQTTARLVNVQASLNSTTTDIRKYDSLYEQKSQELDQKKKELSDTQTNLQKETLFKQQFQKQSEDYYRQILILNSNITKLTNRVADLTDELDECNDLSACLDSKAGSSGDVCYD
jgi:chromosome segregation ATPase